MGIINMASGNSAWRGLHYYKENNVSKYKKLDNSIFEGKVKGSNNKEYNVYLDIKHPRKSKCDCPHAKDKRIICKHIVALYFTVFPEESQKFVKDQEELEKEYEQYEQDVYDNTIKYIRKMSKEELQNSLIEILEESPEWVYDRFVRDKVGY